MAFVKLHLGQILQNCTSQHYKQNADDARSVWRKVIYTHKYILYMYIYIYIKHIRPPFIQLIMPAGPSPGLGIRSAGRAALGLTNS